ncbi:MAG: DciA family protein [Thiobacillaceae bacterium]
MSASSLSDLLASQLPAALQVRAKQLMRAQAVLDGSLPPALAGSVWVAQLENGNLHLACESGAVASRLRNQTRALADTLSQRGLIVDHVRVSVKPELQPISPPVVNKPGMPASALTSLAQLNTEIEDGPLKQALGRLLSHHKKS